MEKMTEAQALDLMNMAYSAVMNQVDSKYYKIKTMAWYKARKTLRGSPLQGVQGLLGQVPAVGSALSAAVGQAAQLLDARIKTSKLASARSDSVMNNSLGALRKSAKYEAKDLKDKVAKLDSNQVKLKDAFISSRTKIMALNKGNNTFDDMLEAAKSISSRIRYEMKILYMIEDIESGLDQVKKYIDQSQNSTFKLEAWFIDWLQEVEVPDDYEEASSSIKRPLLSRQLTSSSQ